MAGRRDNGRWAGARGGTAAVGLHNGQGGEGGRGGGNGRWEGAGGSRGRVTASK